MKLIEQRTSLENNKEELETIDVGNEQIKR